MTMLKSLLALAATFAACSAVVNPANYDGECYYPLGDPNFPSNDLAQYSGRWYQVAGTFATFTLGCTCIYADYSANANGTINVTNFCQRIFPSTINGLASPVDSAYGPGALQVRFPSVPGGGVSCPGPNYIVQKYDPQYAIVQSPNWDILFILSRKRQPAEQDIQAWIDEAVALGTKRSDISRVKQDNCK